MPPKSKSSKKKKGKLSKEQKERLKQCRQEGNQIHAKTNNISRAMASDISSIQVNQLLADLEIPRPIQQTSLTIRKLLALSGTDVEQNDKDLFGDGDQSGCGMLGMEGESTRQILRSLFSNGGDLDSYLCYNGFSPFGYACGIGDVATVRDMLEATEAGSLQRKQLLERRETGMRFSPLCLTIALYKSREHVSMRLEIPVSQMDHLAVLKLLLKYGAIPDTKEVTGKSVVHYAAGVMATEITLNMCDYCIDAARSSKQFGKEIILRNLTKDEYNGLEGKLRGYLCDNGRREVILNKNDTSLAVKPANIFFKQGEKEVCIYDETRNLVNDQDRVGMISLHEVFMSHRLDVAQYLTEKHSVSIDLKCPCGVSVRKLAYKNVSDMAILIRKYGTKLGKQIDCLCAFCGKSDERVVSKCARCKKVTYCSVECQRSDWNIHKRVCKPRAVKSVKIEKSVTNTVLDPKLPNWIGEFKIPDGVEIDEIFWVKVQLCQTGGGTNSSPHLIYDKSRTCAFYLQTNVSGYKEIDGRVKEEDTYMGLKAYFKASFGQDGSCIVYLDESGLKNW